jgi:DNA-binding XRE family transcriptional regulator
VAEEVVVARNKLDMATAREIRRIHSEEGASAPELAKRYAVARSTMYQLLRGDLWREPVARRRPVQRRKSLSNEEIAEITRLRSLGLNQARIGVIVGVSATTVGKALKSP